MDWQYLIQRLHLHYDRATNDEISPERRRDHAGPIHDWDQSLAIDNQAKIKEFPVKTFLANRLEKAWAQFGVNPDGCPDYLLR